MATKAKTLILCAALFVLVACLGVDRAEKTVVVEYPRWKWSIGDKWEIETTVYARGWVLSYSNPNRRQRAQKDRIFARYTLTAEVTGKAMVDDVECWKVDFTPQEDAPKGFKKTYRTFVSARDGSVRKISLLSGRRTAHPSLRNFSGIRVLTKPPYGFPVEMIPWQVAVGIGQGASAENGKGSAIRRESLDGETREIEIEVHGGWHEHTRLRQTWKVGDNWWTTYEKTIKGHKDLEARIKRK